MSQGTEAKITSKSAVLRMGIKHMMAVAVGFAAVVVAGISILLFSMGSSHEKTIRDLQEQISGLKEAQIKSGHYLISTVTHNEERRKKVLFLRNQIMKDWVNLPECPRCETMTPEKAFNIANTNVEVGEKYPEIDPLLITALQWQESKFNAGAVSPVGAVGIGQIMPTTGRMLAGMLGMSYDVSVLYNPNTNTDLTAKYLSTVYKEYKDWQIVLAEYNGGPWGAHYFRTGDPKLHPETKAYVPSIMNKWGSLEAGLKVFNPNLQDDLK